MAAARPLPHLPHPGVRARTPPALPFSALTCPALPTQVIFLRCPALHMTTTSFLGPSSQLMFKQEAIDNGRIHKCNRQGSCLACCSSITAHHFPEGLPDTVVDAHTSFINTEQ